MNNLPIHTKKKALELRQVGYSIEEISKKLGIAKSTSSLWVRNVELNSEALVKLNKRRLFGYKKAALIWREKLEKEKRKNFLLAEGVIKNIRRDTYHNKLYCSLLYWCEGGKGEREGVRFVNSDPILIKIFLNLFKSAFPVKISKLRVLMHLHEYHDEKKQKKFWSGVTEIPESHFYKTFLKANTGKKIKDKYPGCIAIYYNDCSIAREIKEIYKAFSK